MKELRSFDFARVPLHDGTDLLYSPLTRTAQVESAIVARILTQCGATASLEEHAARAARLLGAEAKNVDVLGLLRRMAAEGFLQSHDAIAERLPGGSAAPRAPLSRIVIPTGGRSRSLGRAVSSFAQNARQFGRSCEVLVVDDDKSDGGGTADALAGCDAAGATVLLLDRAARTTLVDALAREAGLDREIVAFALAPADPTALTTGAARNAALLMSAGERFVSIDDDQVCRLVQTTDDVERRRTFAVSSNVDPTELDIYADAARARADHRWIELDYLGAHDGALGNDASTEIRARRAGGDLTFEHASPTLVRALLEQHRTVVATTTGYVGDSGLGSNSTYLLLKGASRTRMLSSGRWEDLRNSREVLRAPRGAVLSDVSFGMGGGLGLDGRTFLPPHFPTGRNQDGAFAAVLRACRPHDPTLWLPLAVLHDPDGRVSPPDALTRGAKQRRINDLLGHMAAGWSSPAQDAEARAKAFGAYLIEWGGSSAGALEELVRMQSWRRRSVGLEQLERSVEDATLPPAFREDAKRLGRALREATLDDPLQMDDLTGSTTARSALIAYGRLLAVWGDLLRAARVVGPQLAKRPR